MPKNVEGGPLGVFEHPFSCKIGKNEEGTLWGYEKKLQKSITKPKKVCTKKTFDQGWTRTYVLPLGRPQKNRNLYAKCQ